MQVWRPDFLASILMKNSIGSPILIGTPATARWSKPKFVLKRQIQSTTSCWFDKYKYNRQIQSTTPCWFDKYKYNRQIYTNTIDQTQIQSTTSCWFAASQENLDWDWEQVDCGSLGTSATEWDLGLWISAKNEVGKKDFGLWILQKYCRSWIM